MAQFLRQYFLQDPKGQLERALSALAEHQVVTQLRLPRRDWLFERIAAGEEDTYRFTSRVAYLNGRRIEQTLSRTAAQFDRALTEVNHRADIDRYLFVDETEHLWQIDYFRSRQEVYFVLMEILTDVDLTFADVPDFIRPWVVYSVTPGDDRFGRRFLSNVRAARSLIADIVFLARH